ncbi:hypothetical protein BVAVS116_0795 [Borreliella valaisiana VS116]|uniref:Uncharacterized protein n=1 Tax=Borreliella valaisiana VS116 TaxID=445987 RepID=D6RWC1_BORVA|nr:hypothetical protein BVAVS116_0795 [Borreliella valaisiana VS116]
MLHIFEYFFEKKYALLGLMLKHKSLAAFIIELVVKNKIKINNFFFILLPF